MTSLPQKPLITKPPGVPLPETSCFPSLKRRSRTGTSGKGLLGSIGFHLGLALIAGAIVLTGQGSTNKDGNSAAEGKPSFEMNLSTVNPSESPKPPNSEPPAVFFTSVRSPAMVFPELASTVNLPPSEPIQPVIAPKSAQPPSTAESGKKSPPASGASSGRSPSKTLGHGQTVKRTQAVAAPKLLQAPPPRYPAKAKAGKITGMAAVLIRVSGSGSAGSTSLYHSSGNSELDQAAVAAARGWKFSPTPSLESGETIPVVVHVTFSL